MSSSIADLAARREELEAELAGVMRSLLTAVVDRVEAAGEGERVNVRALAREAKVSPQTVYTELGKRQERRDQLSSNGSAPAAAPHDDDRGVEREPTRRLSPAQRRVLDVIAAGGSFATGELNGRNLNSVDILRERGLLERDELTLTRAGREVVERGGAA